MQKCMLVCITAVGDEQPGGVWCDDLVRHLQCLSTSGICCIHLWLLLGSPQNSQAAQTCTVLSAVTVDVVEQADSTRWCSCSSFSPKHQQLLYTLHATPYTLHSTVHQTVLSYCSKGFCSLLNTSIAQGTHKKCPERYV
jgi:hypothetical protein